VPVTPTETPPPAQDPAPGGSPATGAGGVRSLLRPKRIAQAIATLGAITGALVGITSLVDWVSGKLADPPAAAVIEPRILGVERQDPQSLGDYLRHSGQSRRGYTRAQLRGQGLVFAVTMRIRGEPGARFPLAWFIVDVTRGRPLHGPSFEQEPAIFSPRNGDQTRTWPAWVPYPPRAGRYHVTFQLKNAKREPIAQRVAAFRVR
jgi:hypothetical protein